MELVLELDSSGWGYRPIAGAFDYHPEHSGCIKDGEFIEYLRDCKSISVPKRLLITFCLGFSMFIYVP
jgi:hypothetical protein